MIGDMMKKAAGSAGSLGEIKKDVVLLKDEAVSIMKEIEELQKIAASLMQRQKKVMEAIGRLKSVADGGGTDLLSAVKKK
jgi:hypothetical protein